MNDDIAQQILEKLDSLEKGQAALEKGQAENIERFDRLEKGQAKLQGSVASLEERQAETNARLTRIEVLAESETDRLDTALELLGSIAEETAKIPAIESAVTDLQADNKIMKAAVTETNRELHQLEERVIMLEVKA